MSSFATSSASLRKIIHCDCDCFYAAIEMRDDPSLRDRPIAVGGRPEERGVVATCNYEARKYGIHSAMSSRRALARCPHLVILPPAMEKYREASRRILGIYHDYTGLVEPLSLDEAYLDVTGSDRCHGSGTLIAQEIRARIAATVGITASAGVAPNKFLAKIASDWNKPDGLYVVRPEEVEGFVAALPVHRIFGVGKVTAAKLSRLGANTCGDLRAWSLLDLQRHFGTFGGRLYELCRGLDPREVCPSRERKSVSVETTYVVDLPDLEACVRELPELIGQLRVRMERHQVTEEIRKLFVKIRFSDFTRTTAECVAREIDDRLYVQLAETAYERGLQPVRLLGVGVRVAEENATSQVPLFN